MRWYIQATATSLAVFLAIGCSETQRPIQAAKPVKGTTPVTETVELTSMDAPGASEPDAVAVVQAAIQAHTGGKPELLQSLKSVRILRDGQGWDGGQIPIPLKWEVRAHWPDQLRFDQTMPGGNVSIISSNGEKAWKSFQGNRLEVTPEEGREVLKDSSVEWLGLLFPLIDSTSIVTVAKDTMVNARPAVGVRIWSPNTTDAILHFDAESKLLVQITFNGKELDKIVHKQVIYYNHKNYNGITLGDKTVLKVNKIRMLEWATTSMEVSAKFDPKVFEKP